jgi:uncharacterized protein YodC (DUF2158 family)
MMGLKMKGAVKGGGGSFVIVAVVLRSRGSFLCAWYGMRSQGRRKRKGANFEDEPGPRQRDRPRQRGKLSLARGTSHPHTTPHLTHTDGVVEI